MVNESNDKGYGVITAETYTESYLFFLKKWRKKIPGLYKKNSCCICNANRSLGLPSV